MKTRILILLLLALTAVACTALSSSPEPLPTVNPQQHLIFHNGVILTMDAANPQAEAVEITGEKITAVGTNAEILPLARAESTVVDLHGRTLMPGFVDTHTHLFNDAEQTFDMSLAEVQQIALQNGITTIGDMYIDERFLREIEDFALALRIRTSLYLVMTDNCGKVLGDWYKAHPVTRHPGEMLWISGVKIFTDGGTCERPALSYELRPGEGLSDLFHTQEALNEMVLAAQNGGYQVAIHAIGDRAVEQAQNAIASALGGQPNRFRHRIEHNSVIRPELLPRYGEIGIIPVVFGLYPGCNPFGPPPPPEYQAWEWPTRALLDANPGLPVAWHGDDPFFGRIRPLDDLYSLITRNDVDAEGTICPAPAWHQAHTITAAEALPMMTINAAYALFRDEEVGSIAVGKYADLIALPDNPLTVAPEALVTMEVLLTMVGGRVEFCAPGYADLCPAIPGTDVTAVP
ncbi:MAG: amidohydrolase family protein [Anaerolineae bacterium]|nr:amidohydrolase family protein [Anaerolineae bacterium]